MTDAQPIQSHAPACSHGYALYPGHPDGKPCGDDPTVALATARAELERVTADRNQALDALLDPDGALARATAVVQAARPLADVLHGYSLQGEALTACVELRDALAAVDATAAVPGSSPRAQEADADGLAEHLAAYQWYSGQYDLYEASEHRSHNYNSDCAICRHDLRRIAEVALAYLDAAVQPPAAESSAQESLFDAADSKGAST